MLKFKDEQINYDDIYLQINIPLANFVKEGVLNSDTGNVVVETMKVIEPQLFKDKNNSPAYELLKKRFDEYANKGQVKFVKIAKC